MEKPNESGPKAGELRILAQKLFAQQNGIDEVQVEEISSRLEESIVDSSFLGLAIRKKHDSVVHSSHPHGTGFFLGHIGPGVH
jgi:hypothetical protein